MVHLPAFVSNTRRVVPAYTIRPASSATPYSSTIPSPLSVFAARHTPWYRGGVPGARELTSTVHSPSRKSNWDASGGGAFGVGACCAPGRPDPTRTHESASSSQRTCMGPPLDEEVQRYCAPVSRGRRRSSQPSLR